MRPIFLPLIGLALVAAGPAPAPYEKVGAIAGPDGGWDFAEVDATHHRLFVAHGDTVMMVDLAHDNSVSALGSVSHAHAVVPIPESEMLAVTSGHDSTVRLIDVVSGKELASIAVPEDPDASIIDPANGHLLTMNAHAGSVSEIDLARREAVRSMALKPGLEFPVIGPRRTLYVNNEDENEIETLDLSTGKAGSSISLSGCEGPTGLVYDGRNKRLIAACANGVAKVVNILSRKVVQTLAIGLGPDGTLIDHKRGLLLIPCGGSGTVEVFDAKDKKLQKLGSVVTEKGARTAALDPVSGNLYLPTARFGPTPAAGTRAPVIPGSFHVLTLRPIEQPHQK